MKVRDQSHIPRGAVPPLLSSVSISITSLFFSLKECYIQENMIKSLFFFLSLSYILYIALGRGSNSVLDPAEWFY